MRLTHAWIAAAVLGTLIPGIFAFALLSVPQRISKPEFYAGHPAFIEPQSVYRIAKADGEFH